MLNDYHAAYESAQRCAHIGNHPYYLVRVGSRFAVISSDAIANYPDDDMVMCFGRAGKEYNGPAYGAVVNGR
jgi:hypothetical protein